MTGREDLASPTVHAALDRLCDARLYAVTFILDYIQLHFDDHLFNAYAPLAIIDAEGQMGIADDRFRNALCALIGNRPSACTLLTDDLAIAFGTTEIRLSLREGDQTGPEAGELMGPIAHLVLSPGNIRPAEGETP